MHKITLFLGFIFIFFVGYAQDSCNTALDVVEGTITTVGIINGEYDNSCNWSEPSNNGEWYKYTTTVNGIITISSDLEGNDIDTGDTKLSVFSGNCGDLSCVTANDDSGANFFSTVTFAVEPGTTYYILWDDFYTSDGFDFILVEEEVNCPDSSLPFSKDFSDAGEFFVCWDLIDSDGDGLGWYVADYDFDDNGMPDGNPTLASNSWDGVILNPDNWAITYGIDLGDLSSMDDILLRWQARGVDPDFPNENYSVYASTGNQISDFLASSVSFNERLSESEGAGVFVDRSLDISSLAGNIIYIAFRHHDSSDEFVLNIDTVSIDVTLGLEELRADGLNYFYKANTDQLVLRSSNTAFSNIEIRNSLGQLAFRANLNKLEEHINLSNIEDGIYFAKITSDEKIYNLNFLKH